MGDRDAKELSKEQTKFIKEKTTATASNIYWLIIGSHIILNWRIFMEHVYRPTPTHR